MAKKKTQGGDLPTQDEMMCKAITESVRELYTAHADEIRQYMADSEQSKVDVRFAATIDCSDSEPLVTTTIRFSQSVTDKRVGRLDNPDQISLFPDKDSAKLAGQREDEASKDTTTRRVKDPRDQAAENGD